jgi:hypothetical protein
MRSAAGTWEASLAELGDGYDRALGLTARKRAPVAARRVA